MASFWETKASAVLGPRSGAGEVNLTVDFWEHTAAQDGSPRGSFATDNGQVSRDLFCRWEQRATFAKLLLGASSVEVNGGVRWISRLTPEPFPELPYLYAAGCPSVAGLGRDGRAGDVATYRGAKAIVEYRALRYRIAEDDSPGLVAATGPLTGFPDEGLALRDGLQNSRYITRLVRPAYRQITIPAGVMVQDVDGKEVPIPEGFPFTEPRLEVTYIHHEVPEVPFNAIGQCMFGVNETLFDNFATSTLLYIGAELTERISPFGHLVTDIGHRFLWQPNYSRQGVPVARGWNYKLRWMPPVGVAPSYLEYLPVHIRLGTDAPHKLADFPSLFRPDQ